MSVYVTYQCSVCRRTKSLAQDNIHVQIGGCTITKGCSGTLYPVGETTNFVPTSPSAGLTDWYPKGTTQNQSSDEKVTTYTALSNSASNVMVLAVLMSEENALKYTNLYVSFVQVVTANIPFTQYSYSVSAPLTIISGPDSTGKILRFDQTAIDNNLISVVVNGITLQQGSTSNSYSLMPNVITLNAPVSSGTVSVVVSMLPPTSETLIKFTANHTLLASENLGAWGNIAWLDEQVIDESSNRLILRSDIEPRKKWFLYTSVPPSSLQPSSLLKVPRIVDSVSEDPDVLIPGSISDSLGDARLLMSTYPHENPDRLFHIYIDLNDISLDYHLRTPPTSIVEIQVNSDIITSAYPPLQLINSPTDYKPGFETADETPFGSANGVSDTFQLVSRNGNKIIGDASIRAIHKTDWQGRQLLYKTPRTNQCPSGSSLSRWTVDNVDVQLSMLLASQVAPYWELTKSNTVVGANVNIACGTVEAGSTQFLTFALRAGTANQVTVGLRDTDSENWGEVESPAIILRGNGSLTQVSGAKWLISDLDNDDTIVQIQRTFLTETGISVFILPQDNSSILITRVMISKSTGSYIPTISSPETVTDYSADTSGTVTFGAVPLTGSILDWDGSGKVAIKQLTTVSSYIVPNVYNSEIPSITEDDDLMKSTIILG